MTTATSHPLTKSFLFGRSSTFMYRGAKFCKFHNIGDGRQGTFRTARKVNGQMPTSTTIAGMTAAIDAILDTAPATA